MAKSKTKVTRKWLHTHAHSYVAVRSGTHHVSFALSDEANQVSFSCWSELEVSSAKKEAETIVKVLELYISELDKVFKVNDPPASGDENWNKII